MSKSLTLVAIVSLSVLGGAIFAYRHYAHDTEPKVSHFVSADSGLGRLAVDLKHEKPASSREVLSRASKAIDREIAGGKFIPGATDPYLWLLDVQRVAISAVGRASAERSPAASEGGHRLIALLITTLKNLKVNDPGLATSVQEALKTLAKEHEIGEKSLAWPRLQRCPSQAGLDVVTQCRLPRRQDFLWQRQHVHVRLRWVASHGAGTGQTVKTMVWNVSDYVGR